MKKTAIILAGGYSERFGEDKGLVDLAGKPLILHVFDCAKKIVEEIIVVVDSKSRKMSYSPLFPEKTKILLDIRDSRSPLIGALTGFTNASGDYSVLLPCDTPFISKQVLNLLFKMSRNMEAVIPRWPNGYIEPLQAVYRTSSAFASAREAIEKSEARLQSMISRFKKMRYVSTMVIKEIDPQLTTFFNINTKADLKKAEKMVKKKHIKKGALNTI